MKRLLIIAVSFLLASALKAQDKMHSKMATKMSHSKQKDCVIMEDGKMMQMKDGKTMMMDHDMKMTNGTMVMTDGSVKMKNGKMSKLKEGDCVMMNGKMTHMAMKKKMGDSKM
ncbi:MAG: hypothetical protein M3Y85_03430 [Bacteroidota bacterium]|nr:hypothetical protein [Bacteroidota bacterium]